MIVDLTNGTSAARIRLPGMFIKLFRKMLSEQLVLAPCLDRVIHKQYKKREYAAPFTENHGGSKNSEQHSRINWVPHISVRPGPNELMVNLKYHFIAPVLAKVDTRPQCSDQTDKCSGDRKSVV